MLESLDNGKSIRESRDCDIPVMVRHFYHHCGKGHYYIVMSSHNVEGWMLQG